MTHRRAPADMDWLTVPQCAAEGQFGVRVIYRAIQAGELRAARIGGRRDYRVHRTWFCDWMERSAAPVEVTPQTNGCQMGVKSGTPRPRPGKKLQIP